MASKGKAITQAAADRNGWPAGVLDLLNDPLRADGWNPWFSEWPNDVNHYEIKIRTKKDVNSIIQKLAKISGKLVCIKLHPGTEPRALGFTTVLAKNNGTAAVFAIGSQKRIDRWYLQLEEIEPGTRKFGVRRYTECPTALPPTLTLFVGNSVIDLAQLNVPTGVEVVAEVSATYRKEHENDPLVKAINRFVSWHRSLQEEAGKSKLEKR